MQTLLKTHVLLLSLKTLLVRWQLLKPVTLPYSRLAKRHNLNM